jgi:acyl transferase domain-containing protein
MMDPIVEPFAQLAGSVRRQNPALPWISTLTGASMDAAPDGSYWATQLRHTVRFGKAIETAIKNGFNTFLEVGPGQALTQLALQQSSSANRLTAITSLGPQDAIPKDTESILNALGRLWLCGTEPDWNAFYANEKRRRITLPTYPFERKSYWIAPPPKQVQSVSVPVAVVTPDSAGDAIPVAAQGQAPLAFAQTEPPNTTQPAVAAETQSNTYQLIEKQVQLMTQQLEILRKRAVAGKSNNGKR